MAGTKGNANGLDTESMKNAVETIREQLLLGLEALAEVERVRDYMGSMVSRGVMSQAAVDEVRVRFVSSDDLPNEVKRFTEALRWVNDIEAGLVRVAQ
jgi:hypothetical protein